MRRVSIVVLSVVTVFAVMWLVFPAPEFSHRDVRPLGDGLALCRDAGCGEVPGASALVVEMRRACGRVPVEVFVGEGRHLEARCRMGGDEVWGDR